MRLRRKNQTCQRPNGTKFAAAVNNISFVSPTTALLRAHFTGWSKDVYTPDSPLVTLMPFNYIGAPPNNTMVSKGTKLVVIPFNTGVELVMQDTSSPPWLQLLRLRARVRQLRSDE